jgi:hypothetical protein
LVGENVLNFHSGDDAYYEDWHEELKDEAGWAVMLNLPTQSKYDFNQAHLSRYLPLIELPQWRSLQPEMILQIVEQELHHQLPESEE